MIKALRCSLVLSLAVAALVAPRPAAGQDLKTVLAALPDGGKGGGRVELAWVSRDLRVQLAALERYQTLVMQTRVGAAFYAPAVQVETYGYDLVTELKTLVDLAAPGGQPVPVGLAVVATDQGPRLQLMLKVEAGFPGRLDAALKTAKPPAWKATVQSEGLEIPVGEVKLVGSVDAQGWLRLSPAGQGVVAAQAPGTSFFAAGTDKWVADADMVLFARGGGLVSELLARFADDPVARNVIESTRALALTWRFDGDRTSVGRLIFDAPLLKEIQGAVRRPDLQNRLAAVWGDEATVSVGIALPPKILEILGPIAQAQLAGSPYALPDKVAQAVAKLDGQIGVVGFGAPGDWAAGIELKEPGITQELVPALQDWLGRITAAAGARTTSTMALEPFPGSPVPVLHLRPDAGLEGARLAAVGTTLVAVKQQSRLTALLGGTAKATPGKKKEVEGMTPLMRQVVTGPAMISAYMLLSDDGSIIEYLAWVAGGAYELFKEKEAELKAFRFLEGAVRRLPTVLTLAGYAWALRYDMGLAADIDDGVLVIQLLSSDI